MLFLKTQFLVIDPVNLYRLRTSAYRVSADAIIKTLNFHKSRPEFLRNNAQLLSRMAKIIIEPQKRRPMMPTNERLLKTSYIAWALALKALCPLIYTSRERSNRRSWFAERSTYQTTSFTSFAYSHNPLLGTLLQKAACQVLVTFRAIQELTLPDILKNLVRVFQRH